MIYDTDKILKDFDGTLPIFSISNFVMFPRTSYNFNIFESQYKDMITDILKSNKLFSINNKIKSKDSKICKTGTLCQIIESKKLDNGNYEIIASGLKKIKIINFLDKQKKDYDSATIEIIEENDVINDEELKRKKLINKFLTLVSSGQEKLNPSVIDASMISTETLTNLASLILPLETDDKQKLLELNDIQLRLEVLCQFLDSELKVESDLVNFNQIIPTNIKCN